MIREINNKTEWEALYSQAQVASGKFLQSWPWREFQQALGRKTFLFAGDGLFALVVELPLPFGKKYWFCPKGPVAVDGAWPRLHDFVGELKNRAKAAGAVFLRLEPTHDGLFAGAKTSHDINPRATSIIDLTKSEEELLAAMHQKTRYNVRVAEKHGVTVERWTMDNGQIYDKVILLFQETAKRDRFNLHPLEYYRKQLESFNEKKTFVPGIKSPHLVIFTANLGDKLLAAAIVMFDGDTATYLHGASSNERRNVMAPYALHWAIMKRAKERGYQRYDLWGISDDPNSGWAGITRFKRGWGGTDLTTVGTLDLPLNVFWYNVYTLARRLLNK